MSLMWLIRGVLQAEFPAWNRLNVNHLKSNLLAAYLAVAVAFGMPHSTLGDEIVIDGMRPRGVISGDFEWFAFSHSEIDQLAMNRVNSSMSLSSDTPYYTIRAGDLWQYLKSQGIDSTDHLTFLLDVNESDPTGSLTFESLEFLISDETNAEIKKMVMDRELDEHVSIPSYEIISGRPEAMLDVPLGFDFMTRFSAGSNELISFRSEVAGGVRNAPSFSVAGRSRRFGWFNTMLLTTFVGFWLIVFWTLKRITLPDADLPNLGNPTSSVDEPNEVKRESINIATGETSQR
ncbi:MAG: hypothetical protein R3C03_02655 [Pirellulaceae bacterium]